MYRIPIGYTIENQWRSVQASKKNKRSSVWNVYREIARPDGSKLKWRYYCLGCNRVMQSTGGTTSNLRIHKCHVRYIKQHSRDAESQEQPQRSHNIIRTSKRQIRQYEEYYHPKLDQYSDVEEDYEDADTSAIKNSEMTVSREYKGISMAIVFLCGRQSILSCRRKYR